MKVEWRSRAHSAIDAAQRREVPTEALDEMIVTEGHRAALGRRGQTFAGR
jgi:hypothetical protein